MRLVVCIKQVPDTSSVKIDPVTHTLVREGVESIMNPLDALALEQALRMKDRRGAEVIALSMGLPQAEAVLREALAAGADRAALVTSRAFAGADTLATSYALSCAIRTVCGGECPEIVLFGKQAIDGDTAQVGPEVSALLGCALVPYVRSLDDISNGSFRATGEDPSGAAVSVEGRLPAVITVGGKAPPLRFASLRRTMEAMRLPIARLDNVKIGAEPGRIGLKGSPTRVVSTQAVSISRSGRRIAWSEDGGRLQREIMEALA